VAPTSLNEGRGEVLVQSLVVALHLNCCLVDGWIGRWAGGSEWYGQKGERVAQMRKGGNVPFWEGRETGFSVACQAESRSSCRAEDKPG